MKLIEDYLRNGYSLSEIEDKLLILDKNTNKILTSYLKRNYDSKMIGDIKQFQKFINKTKKVAKDNIVRLPFPFGSGYIDYKAVKDDNVYNIAKKNNVTPNEVRIANFNDYDINDKDMITAMINLSEINYIDSRFGLLFKERLNEQQKIIDSVKDLSVKGYVFEEIAFILEENQNKIKKIFNLLNDSTSFFYDIDLYNKINKEQKNNYNVEEKVLFQRFIDLENKGVNKEISNYSAGLITKKYVSYKRALSIIDYVINNDSFNYDDIKHYSNASKDFIYKLMNRKDTFNMLEYVLEDRNRINFIISKFNKNNYENKEIHITHLNKEVVDKKNIIDYEVLDKEIAEFYLLVMLTFKISIDDLAEITKLDVECLNYNFNDRNLIRITDNDDRYYLYRKGKLYLSTYATSNEERRNKASEFIFEYQTAKKEKNKKKIEQLDKIIHDDDAIKIMKSRTIINRLTDSDKKKVYDYIFKYGLTLKNFRYSLNSIEKNCPEEYREELNNLIEHNKAISRNSSFIKKRTFKR